MNEGLPIHPLAGRTALITGGGRGVGASVARLFATAGARLALTGRSEESLRKVADSLQDGAVIIPSDLSRDGETERLFDATLARLGQLDILVNNVGALNFTQSQKLTEAEADDLWRLNARSPLILAGRAAEHMASRGGGSIVNLSSVIGSERAIANQTLYGATKAAVDGMTLAMAAEWGPKGVRVNAVRPAVTNTDMSAPIFADPEWKKTLTAQYALGRLGEPEDIAQAVLFFASPASSFVTGQLLSVDGGWISTLVH
ncbi:SDR family oxidoreductase [Micromonospora sp. D93]|uniref:SDR family NAD(P)-dependent oxidoreductase n=1 Tax=Micromonospora sp. D93 TaxID=2824886 RepID=UPI001B36680E|nr:SDR family oxidoreductase [Micromonospora sp. D93]MBQ1017612.1 SDR family oxidoreductase [Micromonospora sp. D93]